MESNKVNEFLPSDGHESGSSLPDAAELSLDISPTAGRDEVIETFMNKQVELADALNRPGFNLDASQLIDRRTENEQASNRLDQLTSEWTDLGGDDIIAAQKELDSLSFDSTASDRVAAQTRLRDAKNAFFAKYTEAHTNAPANETDADTYQIPETNNESREASRSILVDTPNDDNGVLVPIIRPAFKKEEARRAAAALAEAEALASSAKSEQQTPVTKEEVLANWHANATKLREAKEGKVPADDQLKPLDLTTDSDLLRSYRERKASRENPVINTVESDRDLPSGDPITDLLADSEVVQDYRARKARRKAFIGNVKDAFTVKPAEIQSSGLLDDSKVVSDYLARKAKRQGLASKIKGAVTIEPAEISRSGLLDDSEVVNKHLARKAKRKGLLNKFKRPFTTK